MSLASLALDNTHLQPLAAPRPAETQTAPHIRAIPEGPEARGFVLYVGLDEAKASEAGIDIGSLVRALRKLTNDLAPQSETYAAIAFAPRGSGGKDVDVVRLALQDPAALAKRRQQDVEEDEPRSRGVVIDLSRKRVQLEDEIAPLTYKEFELLQFLVLREGRTVSRKELIESIWRADDHDVPNDRTIDVHIRRLRSKLGGYEDIVITVRGIGYRFDRHADVSVQLASTPSPDF
ncbi:MAG: winged helix-turn-helix transcriptional regulator [Cryobacterium sp.]|nr:winged helix-turn-helix transcriptional regulator [Cryobacterium sp.]